MLLKVYSDLLCTPCEIIQLNEDDDVPFTCILKRSSTIHGKFDTKVRCTHIGDYKLPFHHIGFNTTLLEATSLEIKFPDFAKDGLMGRWKFVLPTKNDKEPTILLIKSFSTIESFMEEAISEKNPDWVRQSYLQYV